MFSKQSQKPGRRLKLTAWVLTATASVALLIFIAVFAMQPGNHSLVQKLHFSLTQTATLPLTLLNRFRQSVAPASAASLDVDSTDREKGLPTIKIDVAPQYVRHLEQRRLQAQNDGILIVEQGDEVPALLTVDNTTRVKTHIRLKGDFADHLTTDQFSLRVKLRGDSAILGMRRFSIQRPQTRGGIGEPMLLEQMRTEGVLAPRYFFAHVLFNDLDMGLMAVEEHFSKELLESQNRREGVIVSIDEQLMWRQRRVNYRNASILIRQANSSSDSEVSASTDRPTPLQMNLTHLNSYNAHFTVFQQNKVWKSDVLRHDYRNALGLLRGYREGWLAPDEVFDMQLLGKYHAILNLWNATHGIIDHNLRFYFNPVSRLFEPVAFDNDAPVDGGDPTSNRRFAPFYQAWTSTHFVQSYMDSLRELDRQWKDGTLPRVLREKQSRIVQQTGRNSALGTRVDFDAMRRRLDFLLANEPRVGGLTRPSKWHRVRLVDAPRLDSVASAMWVDNGDASYLEIVNLVPLDVRLERIWMQLKSGGGDREIEIDVDARNLQKEPFYDSRTRIPVTGPMAMPDAQVFVELHSPQLAQNFVVEAIRYFPPFKQRHAAAQSESAFLALFEFIEPEKDGYVIRAGDWRVNSDMIVPPGKALRIEAGAVLRFARGTRMVVRSKFTAAGTKAQPVRFLPQEDRWAGLVLLAGVGADYRSVLNEVQVSGVSFESTDYWRLTGALTVNRGSVTIGHSRFSDIDVEDAINVIDATASIHDTVIEKTKSDAIDLDFCQAKVTRTRFAAIGGDGLDVSGSQIEADELKFFDIADKALSIGEKSKFSGSSITVRDSDIGIAAKDGSVANLSNSSFSQISNVAYTAYIKKPEYSAASLNVVNTTLDAVEQGAIAVTPSSVSVDGDRQRASRRVNSKMYAAITQLDTARTADPTTDSRNPLDKPSRRDVTDSQPNAD